jgi:DNA-binding MarR family transcriptional regulator
MGRHVWLTAPQQEAWLYYMGVYHRLEYEMNRQLQSDYGLSLAEYTVMNALSSQPRHRMQSVQLATRIGWERSRLSHQLRRMEGRHLVERVPSATDRRAVDARLTKYGWQLLQKAAPDHVTRVRKLFFSDLDPNDARQLGKLLRQVYQSIVREGTLLPPN